MHRRSPPTHSVRSLAVVGAVAAVLLLAGPSTAGARVTGADPQPTTVADRVAISADLAVATSGSTDSAPAPQLQISVDNGRTSAAVGDSLTYTVTVRNLGATDLPGLLISQTVPVGLQFDSADAAGTLSSAVVLWTVDLKATDTTTLHTTMTVTETPAELLRLASVACATLTPDGAPIVCASHSDLLPAGAAATSGDEAAATATTPAGTNAPLWWIVGGALVVAAAAAALLLRRRRKRGSQQPSTLRPDGLPELVTESAGPQSRPPTRRPPL